MRTTVSIDPRMLQELVKATGARSRSAALNKAAEEYVRRRKLDELKDAWLTMETADVRPEARDADLRRERFLERPGERDGHHLGDPHVS